MRLRSASRILLGFVLFSASALGDSFDSAVSALENSYTFSEKDPYFASVLSLRYPKPTLRFSRVETYPTGQPYSASCALQKSRADLVIVVPGLGSTQYSEAMRAIGEHVYRSGFSVCLLSNSFHQEIFSHQSFIPGDFPAEKKFFWEVTRSLMIQLRPRINKVHLLSISYGTHIARGILESYQKEIGYLSKNLWKGKPVEMGGAVFLSPPRSLLKSMKALDSSWHEYGPSLKGVGTWGLFRLASKLLAYIAHGTIDPSTSRESYRAFILKQAFYLSMEDLGKQLAKIHHIRWNPHPMTFEDYYKEFLIPLVGRPEPRDFSLGWETIKVPALILFSDDDFILQGDDIAALQSINDPANFHYSVVLSGGGHMGFAARDDVNRVIELFLKDR